MNYSFTYIELTNLQTILLISTIFLIKKEIFFVESGCLPNEKSPSATVVRQAEGDIVFLISIATNCGAIASCLEANAS